jgi:hypothetical protein
MPRKVVPGIQWKGRLRDGLYKRLVDASQTHGVSLNEEIVIRLEKSFERESLIDDVLDLAYGKEWASFLKYLHKTGNMRLSDAAIERLCKATEKFLRSHFVKGNVEFDKAHERARRKGEVI